MTVIALPTNGRAKPGGPRHVIEVERHELVGRLMDLQSLAAEAIDANGASLQTVLRLPPGPWRTEMQMAHIATHEALVKLIAEVRMATGRYDGRPDRA